MDIVRHSEIRVTDVHGVTHTGEGAGMAEAVRDLVARHAADADQEPR
jgi:hypothetical protein